MAIGAISAAALLWLLSFSRGTFRSSQDLQLSVILLAVVVFVGAAMCINVFGQQYRIGAQGIEHVMFWRRQMLSWSDIETVNPTHVPYFVRISCRNQTSVTLSFLMRGSGTLAEQMLEHLPASVFDRVLRERLIEIRGAIR